MDDDGGDVLFDKIAIKFSIWPNVDDEEDDECIHSFVLWYDTTNILIF